ncbi:hypothetical protein A2U01_0042140, partial [Trifolium medium]|nr:hypothetical protein [Trifolium medium]
MVIVWLVNGTWGLSSVQVLQLKAHSQ